MTGVDPPHAPRNRADCGNAVIAGTACLPRLTPPGIAPTAAVTAEFDGQAFLAASRPPESRRLRRNRAADGCYRRRRLTPPGIAPTAAARTRTSAHATVPPHAPRNRADCGRTRGTNLSALWYTRLTPPGIAPTAADSHTCLGSAWLRRLTPPGIAPTAAARGDPVARD